MTTNNLVPGRRRWKPIKGTHKQYWISEDGKVQSRRFNKIIELKPGILKSKGKPTYRIVVLCYNNKRYTRKISKLVAIYFVDNPENKPIPNHLDGDKFNDHYTNLKWATYSENNQHAYDLGLNPIRLGRKINHPEGKGENNTNAKLTWKKVNKIRKLANQGMKTIDLSKRFNVTVQMINNIKGNRSWVI